MHSEPEILIQSAGLPLVGRLPSISVPAARLCSLVLDERADLGLPPGMTLSPRGVVGAVAGTTWYRLHLQGDDGALEIVLRPDDPAALAMAAVPRDDTRLHELAAEALLGPLLDPLRQRTGVDLRAVGVEVMEAAFPVTPAWCVLQSDDGTATPFTAVALPDATLQRLRSGLHRRPGSRRWRARLQAPGRVILARRVVRLPLLQSLCVGDVLLWPGATGPIEGRSASVSWGAAAGRCLTLPCRLDAQALTIEGEPRMNYLQELEAAEAADDTLDTLGELDIPVRFEIETVAVPLSELEALQPGCVLELATPLHAACIRLVAFGQTIGHAELVAVGEQLGARITRLATRDDRAAAR